MLSRLIAAIASLALASAVSPAQQPPLHALDGFPLSQQGPVLSRPVQSGEPFTVAGQRGILVGRQQGPFECWVLPVKLLSRFTVEANVEGYPVPIDLNSMAREIEVRPDRTTITYAHIALTLSQIMFSPDNAPSGAGPVVLFQIDSIRPVDLVFRFTPEMRKMWPAPSSGFPAAEWVTRGPSGFYVLHTDFPNLAGAVALPGATPGILAPYQESPQTHPLEFHLRFDPKADSGKLYPLLMAVGVTPSTASSAALEATLDDLNARLPAIYAEHLARYRSQQSTLTSIVTPNAALNSDFDWAIASIGQLRARTASGETALVAGYYSSGDSARPGFGWFFGRDALYSLYAIDGYGDFPTARDELRFLIRRQRADGKIMHEYSQTADQVDWNSLPYEYAAADSTPLFLAAMLDYVRVSGDLAFLRDQRDAVAKAWQFETTHDADGDGIYDNSQGTGWVESWPTGMPKQEIYLALLDEQASLAMVQLGALLDDPALADRARQRAAVIHQTIEREYFLPSAGAYAFSSNNGRPDPTATVYPAIAWWNPGAPLDRPQTMLRRWASHDFNTDWGLRDIAASDPLYDPISYHQGSVWPLFTGWAAIAQYRAGNPLAGYQALMENANLTAAQDIGAVTELLSGDFFEPFGRSTSHQLWSSAMVVTPILRGIFGIDVDAPHHQVSVAPHLPAQWNDAEVDRLHVGQSTVDIRFAREGRTLVVSLHQTAGEKVRLAAAPASGTELRLPLPAVEVGIDCALPLRGARTSQMKVLSQAIDGNSLKLDLEGRSGTEGTLHLRRNDPAAELTATGAALNGDDLRVNFAPGSGYTSQQVVVHW